MALRPSTQAAASTPAFEAEDTATAAAPEQAADTPVPTATETQAAPAVQSTTTEIMTKANNTALAAALKRSTALDDLQNVISADMLEGMSIGAFPRVVVDLGGFTNKTNSKFLGTKVEIEVLSWNFVTLITAGEQNNKEADKLIKNSYDGINIVGGHGLVSDYVESLKVQGYKNATAKKYVEVYCNLLWTEKDGEIPEDDQRITQISVSPQSVALWGAFLLQQRVNAQRGKTVGNRFVMQADRKTIGANTFGVIQFGGRR